MNDRKIDINDDWNPLSAEKIRSLYHARKHGPLAKAGVAIWKMFFQRLHKTHSSRQLNAFYLWRSRRVLRSLKDAYPGRRCFIIGNGPSLNQTDLSKLKGEVTFAVNRFYLIYGRIDFRPTFFVAHDDVVIYDYSEDLNALTGSLKFWPILYRPRLRPGPDVVYINLDWSFYDSAEPAVPRFSPDCETVVYNVGSSLYTCLQLAFHMGFSTVYLIGVDFHCPVPNGYKETDKGIYVGEEDTSHFHPDYFGKGRRWKAPDVAKHLEGFQFSRDFFERHGRSIYNATNGSELEVFQRVAYDSLF